MESKVAAYFDGKRVLITGAASGIGAELVRQMLAAGAVIRIADWNEEALAKSKERLSAYEGRVSFYQVDVSKQEQVEAMVKKMAADYDGFDMIVNNAGIIDRQSVENTSIERFKQVMDLNFWGVLYGCYAALPIFLAQGLGHIVNTASLGGILHTPYQVAYCTSKSAALAFSDGLRYEMERKGIDVSTVCPGDVQSGLVINSAKEAQPELYEKLKEPRIAKAILGDETGATKEKLVNTKGRVVATTPFACSEIMEGLAEKAPIILTPREYLCDTMQLGKAFPYYFHLTGQEALRAMAAKWGANMDRTGNPDGL